MDIIALVECDICKTSQTLLFPDPPAIDDSILQWLLNDATKVVSSARRSLVAMKHKDELVQKCKRDMSALLRNLDLRVSQLDVLFPPCRPETTPVLVDTGEMFSLLHPVHY